MKSAAATSENDRTIMVVGVVAGGVELTACFVSIFLLQLYVAGAIEARVDPLSSHSVDKKMSRPVSWFGRK
jgi:hypothetical protein